MRASAYGPGKELSTQNVREFDTHIDEFCAEGNRDRRIHPHIRQKNIRVCLSACYELPNNFFFLVQIRYPEPAAGIRGEFALNGAHTCLRLSR